MKSGRPISLRGFFKEHVEVIALVFFLAIGIRLFVLSVYRIPNEAMAPTLLPGDLVFGFRLPYGLRIPVLGSKLSTDHLPARGDLVVFQIRDESLETSMFLKRVIGLPGDRIEIRDGRIILNGASLTYEDAVPNAEARAGLPEASPASIVKWEVIGEHRHQVVFQRINQEPIVVPPQSFYALNDRRGNSDDSRQFGPIAVSQAESSIFLIWLSLDWKESHIPTVRWGRVLHLVD